ncbi:MAG: DUF481 domain-containing protein [Wenzhouxiangellaceae bacterium]|nr:DUF481 domain-containing protein [Wenzhouxiangellaceae bacterium]
MTVINSAKEREVTSVMTLVVAANRVCRQVISTIVVSSGLVMLAAPAQAEWAGSAELGLVFARGNTETETLNTALEASYSRQRWTNTTEASFFRSETDGDLDASRFVGKNATDYTLDDRSYLTGIVRYDRDRFSSFRFQTSAALGYGYQWLDSERQTLSLEAGPGVRHSENRASGDTETEFIGRGAVDYRLAISETAELTNAFLVETGSSNTFLETQLALEVAINDSLALKTGFSVRHNTNVEADRDKTDYLSTVNLVYSFDKNK